MKQSLYIIGSSGYAKVIIDAVELQGTYQIEGLIDDFKTPGERVLGYPVVGGMDWLQKHACSCTVTLFIAIGSGYHREAITQKLKGIALQWATVVHPNALVSRHADIGAGSFVAARAMVAAGARVGAQALINHGAQVDHDSCLGDYVTISPGAILCGNVVVGTGALIGANATVIERICVGEHCVIGANSTVLTNVEPLQVAVGTPARVVKYREKNQPYFGTKHV